MVQQGTPTGPRIERHPSLQNNCHKVCYLFDRRSARYRRNSVHGLVLLQAVAYPPGSALVDRATVHVCHSTYDMRSSGNLHVQETGTGGAQTGDQLSASAHPHTHLDPRPTITTAQPAAVQTPTGAQTPKGAQTPTGWAASAARTVRTLATCLRHRHALHLGALVGRMAAAGMRGKSRPGGTLLQRTGIEHAAALNVHCHPVRTSAVRLVVMRSAPCLRVICGSQLGNQLRQRTSHHHNRQAPRRALATAHQL